MNLSETKTLLETEKKEHGKEKENHGQTKISL